MAGAFEGDITLPQALCAEMAFNPNREFTEILHKVTARQS
jgi:hypothetical protein